VDDQPTDGEPNPSGTAASRGAPGTPPPDLIADATPAPDTGTRPPAPAPHRSASLGRRLRTAFAERSRLDLRDHLGLAWHLLRWVVLGAVVGVLAGVSSWALLEALIWATDTRQENPWLLFLLPLAGFAVGAVYHRVAGRAVDGNNLLLDEIHSPADWIPRRMAFLIYGATVITQIFGGSAGREGTALQMAGSLTDWFCRLTRLGPADRRLMLIAALSGGFGAMFGVPIAGAMFGLEVQTLGRARYEALIPALTASIVGDQVVRALGAHHENRPQLTPDISTPLLLKVALAGAAFALTGAVFIELTHVIKQFMAAVFTWPPLRPLVGGCLIIGLALLAGRDYLGLSLPLATAALHGSDVATSAFALKLLFTSLTLGTGFLGGEVTPLFVIGATLGAAMAHALGMPVEVLAAVGFVAVFAGAANAPFTCIIMGMELFGTGMVLPLAVGCVVSYVLSSHRSIYDRQRITSSKGSVAIVPGTTIDQHRRRA
jgi:H+/Cl- antiporter ClcA